MLFIAYAVAAATGSINISTCSKPAILAALLVASICPISNIAGTVTAAALNTSSFTLSDIFFKTSDDSVSGVIKFPSCLLASGYSLSFSLPISLLNSRYESIASAVIPTLTLSFLS